MLEVESGKSLTKVETREFGHPIEARFIHFPIGKNSDPISKIDDFISL